MREGKRCGGYVVYERGLLRPCAGDDWSRADVLLERRPRRGAGDARRRARVRPPGLRARLGRGHGPGPDGHRWVDPTVTATGRRASRRGTPGPQGALRPLGPQCGPRSRCARSKRSLRVAFRPRSAHTADSPRAAAFDRLLMATIIPPRRAPSALAPGFRTLPQGRLRKPSAHHPDGLARYGFRCTESSCRPLGRGGEPLATARSRRVMGRSLRLAPIDWLNGPSVHRTRWQRVHGPKRYPRRRTP